MRIVQWGYKIPFVTLPPLRLQGQETTYPKGPLKWSSLNQSVQELRNKGAMSQLHSPGLLQPIVPCSQGNRGVEADHRSVPPQCLCALPELHYGDVSVNLQGPSTGPVVNLPRPERRLLSYRDRPSRQTLLTLLSQRHLLAVHSTVIRVVNQSESIYQNTQTCTSNCPPSSAKNCTCT